MKWFGCTEVCHEKTKILPQWAVEQLLKGINVISIVVSFSVVFIAVTPILEIIRYFVVIDSGFLKVDISVS